jgi:LPXTG-motif cell wall-anchored protein
MKFRIPTWSVGVASGLSALATAYVFLSAITTASLRFGYCGATSLDAAEQYCRIGLQLLYLSYVLVGLTLLLIGLTVWLFWRRRKGPNNSFKPKPLRGSA